LLFNSHEYIFLFLPITFFIYFYLNSKKLTELSKAFLVLSSLFFYSWWNISYLPIILSSMLINYSLGRTFAKESEPEFRKKIILIIGIILNISLLGYFKYANFLIENVNFITDSSMPTLELVLPLAISFFTFQQIAYLVDSYKRTISEHDFLNYALFVTFFPQLIAGPIVHHKEMMPQFANIRKKVKNYKNISLGLFIFSLGLFKKVVVADTFAIWVNNGFDKAEVLTFFEAWAVSLSYTFQIYFDFSGYTDMAIGAALLFNIKLPINFNSPYKALDIQDFWRRWHITLSRFLRDYVYIPLGGSKQGKYKTYVNLFTTFIVGGIWHGAGWTFLIWGALHGIAIVVHRIWKQMNFRMNNVLAWIVTFNFVNITWVFFRAENFEAAQKVLSGLIGLDGFLLHPYLEQKFYFLRTYGVEFGMWLTLFEPKKFVLFIFLSFSIVFVRNSNDLQGYFKPNILNLFIIIILLLYSILNLTNYSDFLYFDF